MVQRTLVGLLLFVSLAWSLAIVAAPVALARSTGAETVTIPRLVYMTGSVVCHQRPERTFYVSDTPMPVCARCFGLYAAAPFGLAAAVAGLGLGVARPSPRMALAGAAVPTAATLVVEWTGLLDPGNLARFAAALPLAAIGTWVIARGLLRESASS